eukprot:jgi/Tetstr1/459578/TSEL_004943.t1
MDPKKGLEAFRVAQHSQPLAEGSALASPRAPSTPPPRPPDDLRVILHFDVDAFYAQVEEVREPSLALRPLGITQKYLVVTANYPARRRGVTKLMATSEARRKCPDLVLISGEDLTPYRHASKKIQAVLQRFGTVERLGMDECFVDATEEVARRLDAAGANAPAGAWCGHIYRPDGAALLQDNPHRPQDLRAALMASSAPEQEAELAMLRGEAWWARLLVGSHVAAEARAAVKREAEFRSSAGIACNKMLAKLLPPGVAGAGHPGIGYKMNATLKDKFGVESVPQLRSLTLEQLAGEFGAATGGWVAGAAWGLDPLPVVAKGPPKSITVEDSFKECSSLAAVEQVLRVLSPDLVARLEEEAAEHRRGARTLSVKWRQRGRGWTRSSASCPMPGGVNGSRCSAAEKAEKLVAAAMALLRRHLPPSGFNLSLINLGATNLGAEAAQPGGASIQRMFAQNVARSASQADAAAVLRRSYGSGSAALASLGTMSKRQERALRETPREANGAGSPAAASPSPGCRPLLRSFQQGRDTEMLEQHGEEEEEEEEEEVEEVASLQLWHAGAEAGRGLQCAEGAAAAPVEEAALPAPLGAGEAAPGALTGDEEEEEEEAAASVPRLLGDGAGGVASGEGDGLPAGGGGVDANGGADDVDYRLAMRLQQEEVDAYQRQARLPASSALAGGGRGSEGGRRGRRGGGGRGAGKRGPAAAGPLDAFVKRVKR